MTKTAAVLAASTALATQAAAQTGDQPEAKVVDPFADLPVITIGEATNVIDLSTLTQSPARKYEKANADAATDKLPCKRGWKHMQSVFTIGTNRGPGEDGYRPTSVFGTMRSIVQAAGKDGITGPDLATALRRAQIGNKRSHYCSGNLQPVGWAEGYIDHAASNSVLKKDPKRTGPALVAVAPVGDTTDSAEKKAA